MAQLRAIKANGISLKNAVLKQQYETLKPIELPKQTLYKAKQQLKKIQSAYGTITDLPILLNKKTFTRPAKKKSSSKAKQFQSKKKTILNQSQQKDEHWPLKNQKYSLSPKIYVDIFNELNLASSKAFKCSSGVINLTWHSQNQKGLKTHTENV